MENVCDILYIIYIAQACRSRVTTKLCRKFRDPEEALHFYETRAEGQALPTVAPALHHRDTSTQTDSCASDATSKLKHLLASLPHSDQVTAVGELVQTLAPSGVKIPLEFIAHSLTCMKNLQLAGRSNILSGLAKAIGTMRPDGSDTLMPVSHMPVGLIEYAISFFTSDSMYQVRRTVCIAHLHAC